jgi:hypothetical protein
VAEPGHCSPCYSVAQVEWLFAYIDQLQEEFDGLHAAWGSER